MSFFRAHTRTDRSRRWRVLRFESLESRELLSASSAPFTSGELSASPCWLASMALVESLESDVLQTSAAPKTVVVTTAKDVVKATDGVTSLREALATAGVSTITFADSLQGQTIKLTKELNVPSKGVVVDASGLWDADSRAPGITIDAQTSRRAFNCSGGDFSLIGVKVANAQTRETSGGGLLARNATVTLDRCVFDNNLSIGVGGAVYARDTSLSIVNSAFTNNGANEMGGAIFVENYSDAEVSVTVRNTLFAYNLTAWGGGGLALWGDVACTIANSTLVRNYSEWLGDALYLGGDEPRAECYNTIFALNGGNSGGTAVYPVESVSRYENCASQTDIFSVGSNNIVLDMRQSVFVDAENGDYRLSPHSKLIDAGAPEFAFGVGTSDLRGGVRIVGESIDLGAYEYDPSVDPYVPAVPGDFYRDYFTVEPFYDADKMDKTDSNQCWAGAASSMLWSTGWGRLDGLSDEEDLFHSQFGANFPNEGRDMRCAISWLLNNEYYSDEAKTPGGYYASDLASFGESVSQYVTSDYNAYRSSHNSMLEMATQLRNGAGVGLSVAHFRPSDGVGWNSHALTVYGYEYDSRLDPSTPGYFVRLYVVDSNDGGRMTGKTDRKLVPLDLEWREGINFYGELYDAYVITNYATCGTTSDPLAISTYTYLMQRPAKYSDDGGANANLYLAETLQDVPITLTAFDALNKQTFLPESEIFADFTFCSTKTLPRSTAVEYQVYVDDELVATRTVQGVTGNAVMTNAAPISLGSLSEGTHWVTIALDTSGRVSESNENDNAFTMMFTVVDEREIVVTTERDVVDASDGQTSLREAVALAGTLGHSSTIAFANALRGATITLGSPIAITRDITIDGLALWNADRATPGITVSGGGSSQIFKTNDGANVTFRGLAITNGYGAWGGAMTLENSTVTFDRCRIFGNTSNRYGGAIYSHNASVVIETSVFDSNTATQQGGALFFSDSTQGEVYISNSLFTNNSAVWGGFALNYGINMTLVNVTVANNSATDGGRTMYVTNATVKIYNSIILPSTSTNVSDVQGSTIIARNTFATTPFWSSNDGNRQLTAREVETLFLDAAHGDYRLAPRSLAINAGSSNLAVDARGEWLTRDLAGDLRVSWPSTSCDSFVDVGAYEYQYASRAASPTFLTHARTFADGAALRLETEARYSDARVVRAWRVSWGDGTTETISRVGNSITLAHYYARSSRPTRYSITLEALDSVGGGSETFYVIANYTPPIATSQALLDDAFAEYLDEEPTLWL